MASLQAWPAASTCKPPTLLRPRSWDATCPAGWFTAKEHPTEGYKDGDCSEGQGLQGAAEVPGFAQPRAEQAEGQLMAAAAPHRAVLSSLWSCVRGGQVEVRERFCLRGQQAGPQTVQKQGLNFGWSYMEPGAGLDVPCGAFPIQNILIFNKSVCEAVGAHLEYIQRQLQLSAGKVQPYRAAKGAAD